MAMPRSITTFKQVLVAAAVLAAAGAGAAGGDAGETVKPVAAHDLPNLPGKRLTAVVVTYAPGAPSRHGTTTPAASGPMCSRGRSARRIPRPVPPRSTGRGGELLRAARQRAFRQREREHVRVGKPARSPH